MEKDGLHKINILFHIILAFYSLYFPPVVLSSNEDVIQLNNSSDSVSEEEKSFLSEIEDAVKNEKKHVQEILDSQADRASRNLIIIAGAIVIPVSLFFLLWVLKLIFNISFSLIRSIFSASASGVGAISKRLKETANHNKGETAAEEDKPKKKPMKLGEILINFVSRSVTTEHINMVLTEQKKTPERPLMGQLLIKLGFATVAEVDAALKIQGKKTDKSKT